MNPPKIAAAALSGWPSSSAAIAKTRRRALHRRPVEQRVRERRRRRRSRPRTTPARAQGDPVHAVQRERREDRVDPSASATAASRATPCPCRRSGSSSAPSPSQRTPGSASVSIVTSLHEIEGQAEAVEPGPEVRRGGRDPRREAHGLTSPSSAATAAASAGTVTGRAAPAIAHSGSFSPWPVSTHTTVAPAGSDPRRAGGAARRRSRRWRARRTDPRAPPAGTRRGSRGR